MTIREVVIELRETPDHVQQLHESWLTTGGSEETELAITTAVKEDLERLIGPFTTITELLQRIQKSLPSTSEGMAAPKTNNAP
jgi:hypothetical protein